MEFYVFKEVDMIDPWNNTWLKWKLENIDEAHYYQISTCSNEQKPGFFKRLFQAIKREWILLRCRFEELTQSPSLMLDQQCECIES
jgi:hypothetical protein